MTQQIAVVPDYNDVIRLSDVTRCSDTARRKLRALEWIAADGTVTARGQLALALWADKSTAGTAIMSDFMTDAGRMVEARAPRVGDMLVSSWGYDQTNVSWYRVIRVTAKSVVIQSCHGVCAESGEYSDQMVPGAVKEGTKPMTKRVRAGLDSYSVTINSYADASLWDGTPQRQTGSAYGH